LAWLTRTELISVDFTLKFSGSTSTPFSIFSMFSPQFYLAAASPCHAKAASNTAVNFTMSSAKATAAVATTLP
jgi:hypothetical protein